MSNYLGIDIGGTFIKYAIVDDKYKILKKWKVESIKFDTKDKFYDYMCQNISELEMIESIGVSAPGLIDEYGNVKSDAAPNVKIMRNSNINEEISKRTGKRVLSINDAKSAGLCELKIGNAMGKKSSAFLIIGTGTGGCICDENGVIYGNDSFAGEFHHLTYFDNLNKRFNKMGDTASIVGLINIYNEKVNESDKALYGRDIILKYLNKEKLAIESIEQWINNIVAQLVTITAFYNPETIYIGGGISDEEWLINIINTKYKEVCNKNLGEYIKTKIDRCKYNNDANILGAIINVKCNA
jgi:predicted NBD/HSP70 family sugar kinase